MFIRSILTDLKKWADSPLRKPLILRGARQVVKQRLLIILLVNLTNT